jgi:hypothetical protein
MKNHHHHHRNTYFSSHLGTSFSENSLISSFVRAKTRLTLTVPANERRSSTRLHARGREAFERWLCDIVFWFGLF